MSYHTIYSDPPTICRMIDSEYRLCFSFRSWKECRSWIKNNSSANPTCWVIIKKDDCLLAKSNERIVRTNLWLVVERRRKQKACTDFGEVKLVCRIGNWSETFYEIASKIAFMDTGIFDLCDNYEIPSTQQIQEKLERIDHLESIPIDLLEIIAEYAAIP